LTIAEFRERLRATRTEAPWLLDAPKGSPLSKQIRAISGKVRCCPMVMVGGDWKYTDGGLGLSKEDRLAIIRAADDSLDCDAWLRAGLLADVGLTDG
jgi:hypothetical protein